MLTPFPKPSALVYVRLFGMEEVYIQTPIVDMRSVVGTSVADIHYGKDIRRVPSYSRRCRGWKGLIFEGRTESERGKGEFE